MKILFSPTVEPKKRRVFYYFKEEKIIANLDGKKDIFDFSSFPDGKLETDEIETILTENPIKEAWRENGILYLRLLNLVGLQPTHEEAFPKWIDYTEYIPPKAGEVNGQDEMEE